MFEKLFNFSKKIVPVSTANRKIKPTVLIIMDGWGIAPPSRGNVIAQAKLVNLEKYFNTYPDTELIAAGESVGLPANEVGNTEVGHLTIGTGRVTYQGLKRINMSIEDGSFLRNPTFHAVIEHVKKNNSKLHIMGLMSSGNVHASLPHFHALLDLCRGTEVKKLYVHAFTDGRDAPPREGAAMLAEIDAKMKSLGIGEFATVSGRYYAMDRDRRWERIEKAYQAIVEGKGNQSASVQEALKAAYDKGLTDELVEPTVIMKDNAPVATLDDNDGVIFFNFRIDRPRELTMALTMPEFEKLNIADFGYTDTENRQHAKTLKSSAPFNRQKKPQNLYFVTMTNYHKNIPVSGVAFDTPKLERPMGQIVSENQMVQLRMAESEKERFVTHYFNGYAEGTFPGEETLIVPSPKVPTYDRKPEMSVFKLVENFREKLNEDKYHFFVMNMANPDMVAHTGNIPATIKACQATDKAVGEIVEMVLACDGTVFITADHGNAEELITYPTSSFFFTSSQGTTNTDHSNNPVPFIIINKKYENSKTFKLKRGSLVDVAPTILHHMGLNAPMEMNGKNLLEEDLSLANEAPPNTSTAPTTTETAPQNPGQTPNSP